jgi:ATP-dependent helicase/nuclease subunit A
VDLDAVMSKLLWSYPHQALAHSPARLSMRDYKMRLMSETEDGESVQRFIPSAPVFTLDKEKTASGKMSAAERGALTHYALRHFDLLGQLDYAGISAQLDRLIERGMMTEAQRGELNLTALANFFQTPLAERMLRVPPDRIWREIPFLIGLSPSEALLDDLDAYDDSERIRAQGVIDCLFQEADGGLILLDYKTDALKTSEQVTERTRHYLPQMRVYARAVESVFGTPPKEMYLCFLSVGSVAPVITNERKY